MWNSHATSGYLWKKLLHERYVAPITKGGESDNEEEEEEDEEEGDEERKRRKKVREIEKKKSVAEKEKRSWKASWRRKQTERSTGIHSSLV